MIEEVHTDINLQIVYKVVMEIIMENTDFYLYKHKFSYLKI